MKKQFKLNIFGMAGVHAEDSLFARYWEKKLQTPMIFLAICSIPAIYLEFIVTESHLNALGWWINFIIFLGFSFELLWMLYLSHYKVRYLYANWINVIVVGFTAVSLTGLDGEWLTLIRLLRVGSMALLVARMFHSVRKLYTPNSIPHLVFLAVTTMTMGGVGFYWLEPTVHTYSEGLWLAFITGATVGYGDFLPTTNASRVFAVLIVILGYSVISLIIANISASFVGDEDKKSLKKLQFEVTELRQQITTLNQQLNTQQEHYDRLARIEKMLEIQHNHQMPVLQKQNVSILK